MKVAIIGSRGICGIQKTAALAEATEIVSGGAAGVDTCAAGVDTCAAAYAKENGLKLTVFLPDYPRYGRAAPIVRNKKIVDYADRIVAFWDGSSKGTASVIAYAEKVGKPCEVILCE